MTKTLVLLVALALAPTAARACAACDEKEHAAAKTPPPQRAVQAGEARVTIPVSGMHCNHCASRVEAALKKVEGVRAADADLEKRQATVIFENGKTTGAKLAAAIAAAGYEPGAPAEDEPSSRSGR